MQAYVTFFRDYPNIMYGSDLILISVAEINNYGTFAFR